MPWVKPQNYAEAGTLRTASICLPPEPAARVRRNLCTTTEWHSKCYDAQPPDRGTPVWVAVPLFLGSRRFHSEMTPRLAVSPPRCRKGPLCFASRAPVKDRQESGQRSIRLQPLWLES